MSMRLDIITLFPAMFSGPFDESIIGRARKAGQVDINLINLRDFTHDKHRTVDDRPYGGGAGMVLKPEPIFEAVESLRTPECRVIILSPQGRPFKQAVAAELAVVPHLILICGAYEGFDERVRIGLVDDEISIGDFVMTNGSLPAMVLTDTVVRLLPGVLGCSASSEDESFSHGRLEYPQYTRPDEFRGMRVPDILTSGNHQAVDEWRRQQALDRTRSRRPDLIDNEPTQG